MLNLFKPLALPPRVSVGLLLLRFIAGTAFTYHGWPKIQNPTGWMGPDASIPGVFLALAAVAEFGGGVAWILGLLTPLASFGLACTMAVAVHFHAVVRDDPFVGKGGPSWELAGVYFVMALLFILSGPGKFSLDRAFFGEKS